MIEESRTISACPTILGDQSSIFQSNDSNPDGSDPFYSDSLTVNRTMMLLKMTGLTARIEIRSNTILASDQSP